MSLSNLLLPSITQVLVTNGIIVPVIEKAPVPPLRTVDLMATIDYRGIDVLEMQQLSYIYRTQPVGDAQAPKRGKRSQKKSSDTGSVLSSVLRKIVPVHLKNRVLHLRHH
ncbi:hypothetical protein HYPSUDRAFT_44571 [Hypholoma sublateritium FD-334 SS-4]|uniref:Uncharacterized protein n=1 Tax=Hypholoma sublateritium (strain FD-334 SS-4) TaxID=945553 RepID=A0A0D2NJP3_HYPSF|nr:hypothetical protein HYPSUDRAFT_44571 [Hypholoma sublateritium FD-334 SS-4]